MHAKHVAVPVPKLYVPATQSVHVLLPDAAVNLPAGQPKHGNLPLELYCPGPQVCSAGSTHSTAPAAVVMLPVGQGVHDDAPNTSENVFSLHSSGADMPAAPV